MLKELILNNEEKIEKFNISYYLEKHNYSIVAALSALEATNEIQKCYFELQDKENRFNILKLYALLQSLFVSIDSLYALSYSLTKSKSFININKNQYLRELKYIRNDVVGHPANRMYNSSVLAYCILDKDSVNHKTFAYHIYSAKGIDRKCVDIPCIVSSYYEECNALLDELYNITKEEYRTTSLFQLAVDSLNLFDMGGNYLEKLQELKEVYLTSYPNATSNQHRLLWRLELIDELLAYTHSDPDIMDLAKYAIGIEIIKIYQLLTGQTYDVSINRRRPYLVSSFYRFLKKNPSAVIYIERLNDIKNPLFSSSIDALLDLAKQNTATGPIRYLSLLKELYREKKDALLYALALPIKDYKR
jgi:hypothetical protein